MSAARTPRHLPPRLPSQGRGSASAPALWEGVSQGPLLSPAPVGPRPPLPSRVPLSAMASARAHAPASSQAWLVLRPPARPRAQLFGLLPALGRYCQGYPLDNPPHPHFCPGGRGLPAMSPFVLESLSTYWDSYHFLASTSPTPRPSVRKLSRLRAPPRPSSPAFPSDTCASGPCCCLHRGESSSGFLASVV